MSAPEIVEYPSFAVAKAVKGDDEVIVGFRDAGGVVHYGVGPSHVEVETPRGVRRQPLGEFMEDWWEAVAVEARRKAGIDG